MLITLTGLLVTTFSINEASATTSPIKTENSVMISQMKLTNRLDEIKSMDKSRLTNTEKSALRKEVRTIDKSLRDITISGGIYVSVGVLLLVLLLIILL